MLTKLKKDSLITRIAIGKAVGFAFGLLGFILLPYMVPETSLMIRFGALLWYTTLGAIIGLFGIFTWHPLLKMPMRWWFRAPLLGAWMNFVLTLFAYDQFREMTVAMFGETSIFVSPFWFVLEGAIIGFIIGWLATRFGGEGKKIIDTNL